MQLKHFHQHASHYLGRNVHEGGRPDGAYHDGGGDYVRDVVVLGGVHKYAVGGGKGAVEEGKVLQGDGALGAVGAGEHELVGRVHDDPVEDGADEAGDADQEEDGYDAVAPDLAGVANEAQAEDKGGGGAEGVAEGDEKLFKDLGHGAAEDKVAHDAEEGHDDDGVAHDALDDPGDGAEQVVVAVLVLGVGLDDEEADGVEDEKGDGGHEVQVGHKDVVGAVHGGEYGHAHPKVVALGAEDGKDGGPADWPRPVEQPVEEQDPDEDAGLDDEHRQDKGPVDLVEVEPDERDEEEDGKGKLADEDLQPLGLDGPDDLVEAGQVADDDREKDLHEGGKQVVDVAAAPVVVPAGGGV